MFAMIYSILETFAARILRSKLQELQESRLTERQQREEQQMKSLSTFNELRQELEKATEEIRKLKEERDVAKQERAVWKHNWEGLRDRNVLHEQDVKTLREALAASEEERKIWKHECGKLREDNVATNKEAKQKEQEIKILSETNKKVLMDLENQNKEASNWKVNWYELREKADQYESEIKTLQESLAACDKDIRILKEKLARHRNLCAVSVEKLLHIVSNANNYVAAIRKELTELQ